MNRRRVFRWFLVALAAFVVVLVVLARRLIWRSPSHYTSYGQIELPAPILTAEQYAEVSGQHARPYVVHLETANGAILLYGASHTKDPDDPQIDDLRKRWADFRPSVAIVEGRLGFLIEGLADPVREYGESGFIFSLSRRQGVQVYTWEPPIETELKQVLESHPQKKVALFYILRPYFSNLRHGRPANPDAVVEKYRRKRTNWPGLQNTFGSLADIDALWRQDFPDHKDWRDTSDQYGLPGYLNEIWKTSNAARDQHFARVIIDLVQRNERVFAVCGSSHAVKLEPAMRAALTGE
jgi:hypothetical protein